MAGEPFSPDFIREYVIAAHFNLEKVKATLAEHPELLTAAFQWGPDDFEDGLGAASHVGNRAIAEYYLEQGVPLTICAAAMLGRTDDVRAFLDADPTLANATGAHKIPVMFHAAMSGKTEIADLLVERGGGEGISFSIHGAISHGHLDMTRWLLEHGAKDNLGILNYEQKTPLQKAAELGHTEIADLLRGYGATE
jgi:ankyrin repeat protein